MSMALLIAMVLGLTEASLIHHHAFDIASDLPMTLGSDEAKTPANSRSANVGHLCALCVVGLQGSEPPVSARWIPFSPTSLPLADPPAVFDLATSTHSISKRGPPAA